MEIIEFNDKCRVDNNNIISQHDTTKLCVFHGKNRSNFLESFDNVLPTDIMGQIYNLALQRNGKPWGVYITIAEAKDDSIQVEEIIQTNPIKGYGLQAVRSLILEKGSETIGSDIDRIHGVVVWCLTSKTTNTVEYHIDYAELYRYENNIIVPPLYGGVIHCSPMNEDEMIGGDFMANKNGMEHYAKFGYKGKAALRKGREFASLGVTGQFATHDDLMNDLKTDDWITVKYKSNRGMVFDGNLPHLATEIKSIPSEKSRVILGLNCFHEMVSECCIRAPEHSDAFNRTIKLYQAMKSTQPSCAQQTSQKENSNNRVIKKEDILKNKALCKLLVLAARKVKASENKPSI